MTWAFVEVELAVTNAKDNVHVGSVAGQGMPPPMQLRQGAQEGHQRASSEVLQLVTGQIVQGPKHHSHYLNKESHAKKVDEVGTVLALHDSKV